MFMTWFVVSSRTEFEIKSDHFGGRENNLWQKLANFFFSPLLGIHLALATGFHGSPIVWRKGSGVDDVSRSRDAEGWWIPPTLPSPRLPSPLIRGVENLGAGRIEHSGLQAELPPLYETRGGRGRSGTNARARATTRRTHARTHAATQRLAVHTHQGIPRKDRKTRIEQETQGNEIDQKSGKLYRNEDTERSCYVCIIN